MGTKMCKERLASAQSKQQPSYFDFRSASDYMYLALSGFTAPIDDEQLQRRRHDAVGDAERAAET